jgi:hypothetical protein
LGFWGFTQKRRVRDAKGMPVADAEGYIHLCAFASRLLCVK